MLTAGDEFGRTQQGNNNAYAQDNEITWLDWEKADSGLADFTARLSGIRKAHPSLSDDRFLTGKPVDGMPLPDVAWLHPGRTADAGCATGRARRACSASPSRRRATGR